MSKRREKRFIEFRTFKTWCRRCCEDLCCLPTKKLYYPKCKVSNCPVWKRLKKLNYVARTKDDGAFYEVYWVKAK